MQKENIQVAFADDHVMVRKGIISLLNSVGGIDVIIEADNGQQLITEIEEAKKKPEICILDINMPDMDGFTLLCEIKRKWPDMKILILTASDSELYVIRTMQAGANGYLLKRSDIEIVKEALCSIHSEGYYYSDCANSTIFHLVNTKAIKLQSLTESEITVLKYCCSDLTYGQIAQKMHTTIRSVEGCRDRLFNKLNLNNRTGLALFAIRFGLVTLETNYSGKTAIPLTKTR